LLSLGRPGEAEQAFREGLRIATEQGDAQGSVAVFESAIEAARGRGDRLVAYAGLFNLATAFLALGNERRAEILFRESVALSHENRDAANLAFALDGLAVVEGRRGNPLRSALLLGAAEAMRQASEGRVYHYYLPDEALRERTRLEAEAALGSTDFAAAWDEGMCLDLPRRRGGCRNRRGRRRVTAGLARSAHRSATAVGFTNANAGPPVSGWAGV
jgi:tetratricopeptide (TPR) repeat protein